MHSCVELKRTFKIVYTQTSHLIFLHFFNLSSRMRTPELFEYILGFRQKTEFSNILVQLVIFFCKVYNNNNSIVSMYMEMYDMDYLDPKIFLHIYISLPRGLNFHVEEAYYENITGEIIISFSSLHK